jgi:SAM-dependent methyltransferase
LLNKINRGYLTLSYEKWCPSCWSSGMSIFYEIINVPVHSVLLLQTRKEALDFPKGDIALGFCSNCRFISNLTFDPDMHVYSSLYEETQAFSHTFNTFHRRLANYIIERYDLYDKRIIEIGCGKGEFLTLLCELGDNSGVGFDPAYITDRNHSDTKDQITFIKDFYSEKYTHYQGDFVCCKMTLEHIQNTADFVSMVRRSIGNQHNTIVFFQVPDVTRILKELAFWDIYYEHCSYFSMGSLARLFRACGFDVIDIWKDFGDQYLMIEARPNKEKRIQPLIKEEEPGELKQYVEYFSRNFKSRLNEWKRNLQQFKINGKRSVIWGSGSKGVAFLTTLNILEEITFVVDINPFRQGTYMAGTGQEIVGKDFLKDYKPDVVIIMNPLYRKEISQDLSRMGLFPRIITL